MNSENFIQHTLQEFQSYSATDKIKFIKVFSELLNFQELKAAQNVLSNRKKKLKKLGTKGLTPSVPIKLSVFSLDIEKISVKYESFLVAASVSVVDEKLNEIYSSIIFHNPDDVIRTYPCITGFNKYSFIRGKEIQLVRELLAIFDNNYVIGFALDDDLKSLGINNSKFTKLDLKNFFRKTSKINPNHTEAIGLRHLVYHFYGQDIQSGVHSPFLDAKYLMKLYNDQYLIYKNSGILPNFEEIERLPALDYQKRMEEYHKNKKIKQIVHKLGRLSM